MNIIYHDNYSESETFRNESSLHIVIGENEIVTDSLIEKKILERINLGENQYKKESPKKYFNNFVNKLEQAFYNLDVNVVKYYSYNLWIVWI